MINETMFGNQKTVLLAENAGCSVFRFQNETGDGTMTCYELFPGIMLSFNDFHMAYYESEYIPNHQMFAIDHCNEGRMEFIAARDAYAYMEAGDIKLDRRLSHTGRFVFPSSHYHGVTIAFDLKVCGHMPALELLGISADIHALCGKFCEGSYPKAFHEQEGLQAVFKTLYQVPQGIRLPYFRVKMLELLLYLDALELPKDREERPYFYKTQVEKVKAIQRFLVEHMSANYTQEEIARRYNMSLTGMKKCFKAVYGTTINTWLTEYRMSQAAELLLKERALTVSDIAGQVGYDSSSKFAIAFRRKMGVSPMEYRQALR